MRTARLRLRQWSDADLAPFARLNADPEVMRYFPAPLSREDSDAMVARMRARIDSDGWGLWAVETLDAGDFVGFVGLVPVKETLPFAPAVEVGWRLAREHWHRGYATEAARAAVRFGFEQLGLGEIVSFTAQANRASQAVMDRLGMRRAGAFEHPALAAGSALRAHWLYRLSRRDWEAAAASAAVVFECGRFHAREVDTAGIPALQRFFEANPGYFLIVHGEPPGPHEARDEFMQLPPANWPYTRKWLLAFRAPDDAIVGVADLLEDLFSAGVWQIGLFMAAERLHGTGVPQALYAHLEAWMRSRGARWLRLGVVRDNARGQRFWEKVGYVDVAERRDYALGARTHTLRVMAKPLAGGSLEEYRRLVPRDAAPTASAATP